MASPVKILPALLCLALSMMLTASCSVNEIDFNRLGDITSRLKALRPVSRNSEVEIGKGVAANILGAAPLVPDSELQAYVNKVGKWLALHTDQPDLPWRFGVLDTDSVNAFATPGGYVFITRGLLSRMHDESELAGVLAHEISHVLERHALNTLRKGALMGLAGNALSQIADDRGHPEYSRLVGAGTEIYTRGLDKKDEFAADRMGVVIAARAGYDPFGMAAVLQTLAAINPQDDAVALMFKTHPDPGRRLDLLLETAGDRLDKHAVQPRAADRFAQAVQTIK